MTKNTLPKWNDERTEQLKELVNGSDPVAYTSVVEAAEQLGTSTRSVSSKLRKMGYSVEAAGTAERVKTFNDSEAEALREFVTGNSGEYTFAEIAAVFADGKFTAKQVQGKLLAMELLDNVKPSPKKVAVKKYSEEEEVKFIELVKSGAYIEDIASAMNRSIESVRGKALALLRSHGLALPVQRESHAKVTVDALENLGDISGMSVEDIAKAIEKTPRGVRSMLTHRKLTCSDYDGAARAAHLQEKRVVTNG